MLTSKVQLGYVLTGGGGQAVQGGLSCPPPRISERIDNLQILLHHLLQKYLVERYKLYFSQSEMLTSNVQLGYVLTRGGGQAVQGGLSCPPLRISERIDNLQILLHHLLQEYLVERSINIIQSIWDAHFKGSVGLCIDRGWGASCPGLSCPSPRISERIDNPQILLHHLLQEYLVERDINIISVNLRCSFQRFSWVMHWQGVGGKLSRAVYLAPRPFQWESIIRKFNYTIYDRNI